MEFVKTPISGVLIIKPKVFEDNRGWFARTFCKELFDKEGVNFEIVQINHSFNIAKGTFRGLHFQKPPYAEKKLIRCVAGQVEDVIVDLRSGSPTFLKSFKIDLSEFNRQMIRIPEGIAHGFLTLKENSSLIYHHSEYYRPEAESGLRFDDKRLNISLSNQPLVISTRDLSYAMLEPNFEGLKC